MLNQTRTEINFSLIETTSYYKLDHRKQIIGQLGPIGLLELILSGKLRIDFA